jgi:hypothetical protein
MEAGDQIDSRQGCTAVNAHPQIDGVGAAQVDLVAGLGLARRRRAAQIEDHAGAAGAVGVASLDGRPQVGALQLRRAHSRDRTGAIGAVALAHRILLTEASAEGLHRARPAHPPEVQIGSGTEAGTVTELQSLLKQPLGAAEAGTDLQKPFPLRPVDVPVRRVTTDMHLQQHVVAGPVQVVDGLHGGPHRRRHRLVLVVAEDHLPVAGCGMGLVGEEGNVATGLVVLGACIAVGAEGLLPALRVHRHRRRAAEIEAPQAARLLVSRRRVEALAAQVHQVHGRVAPPVGVHVAPEQSL